MNTEAESGYSIPWKTAAIDMLSIAFLWCLSLLISNPIANIPLNDDWSYALAVKHLIEQGDFRPSGWTSMPLITHVLWGALFCIPFGFSYTALRLSTLTLSLLGIFAMYLLVRELRQPRLLAVAASLTLAFTPIYYALSHTFMTDVPFTTIMIIMSIFFVRNLKTGSSIAFLAGTVFAVIGTLSRQLAITIPAAFTVIFVLKHGITKRNVLLAAVPPFACVVALFVFQQWLSGTDRLPALYNDKNSVFVHALMNPKTIVLFIKQFYAASLYLGWFLLPVLIFVFRSVAGSHRKKTALLTILSILALSIGAAAMAGENGLLMPNLENIIDKSGIGPLTLVDTFKLKLDNIGALPTSFWLVVTIISNIGAVFLITVIALRAINAAPKLFSATMDGNEAARAFLLLGAMVYLLPTLLIFLFDRYLLPAMPFLLAGMGGDLLRIPRITTRICRVTAIALVAAFAVFAVFGTRDYLAWNRIRWEALLDLMGNKHVKAEDIDGGFEFNGLYFYDPKKEWWWARGDTYRIGFGSMPGYTIIKEYPYFRWLPPRISRIVVCKKTILETPNKTENEHDEQNAPPEADKQRR